MLMLMLMLVQIVVFLYIIRERYMLTHSGCAATKSMPRAVFNRVGTRRLMGDWMLRRASSQKASLILRRLIPGPRGSRSMGLRGSRRNLFALEIQ